MKKLILIILCTLIAAPSMAAGFREQTAWQFESPVSKAAKMQAEHMRQMKRGGYYDGDHAVSNTVIFQSNTNIANQSVVDGDNNNVDQDMSGNQSNQNLVADDGDQEFLNDGGYY